jgi:hypothetical protein
MIMQPPAVHAIVEVRSSTVRGPDAATVSRERARVRAATAPANRDGAAGGRWSIRIDSVAAGAWYIREVPAYGLNVNGAMHLRVVVRDGTLQPPTFTFTPITRPRWSRFGEKPSGISPDDAMRLTRHALVRRLLSLAPVFEPAPVGTAPAHHVTRYDDGAGDVALRLVIDRTSRVVRDTLVDRRPAQLIRDSAVITIDHAAPFSARFLPLAGHRREQLQGTMVGTRVVPRDDRVAVQLSDTLELRGTLVERDGTGDTLRTPVLVHETRDVRWRDAAAVGAQRAVPFDMVRLDARSGERSSPPPRAAFVPSDTAAVVQRYLQLTIGRPQITNDEWRLLRNVLRDPALAFRWNIDRELLTIQLLDVLKSGAPVLARSADSAACAPAVCRAMLQDAHARSAPLQAVALVAGMVSEPRLWTDSVLAYAARNPYVATARLFAIGSASNAVAAGQQPIPAPDASDALWHDWLLGTNTEYYRAMAEDTAFVRRQPGLTGIAARRAWSVSPQAAAAIRFAAARTGRDYLGALRRRAALVTSDSAQALYNAILVALGEPVYSEAQLVRALLDTATAPRAAARAQVALLPRLRVPDSLAEPIAVAMVRALFGNDTLPSPMPALARLRIPLRVDSLPRFVHMDSLPESVREMVAGTANAPMPRGWRMQPGEAGHELHFGPVYRRGAFMEMQVSHSTLYRRGIGVSGGYAGGVVLLFARVGETWVVVDGSSWVT